MCTALSLCTKDHYFGRNLDLDRSYGEQVCVTPRRFPIAFRKMGEMKNHYAMIGMAFVVQDTPLYFDAANERGLCMAGLNFPGNAHYFPEEPGCDNVTPFEFIPWVLGQCENIAQAKALLSRINLIDQPFSAQLPLSPLHWIIADREASIVVESMKDGLHVHDNPARVMTNNPPFEYHLFHLNNYRGLNAATPENTLSKRLALDTYCAGLGALGLPGDASSMSRFVRAAFLAENSVCEADEMHSVSQFFHLLCGVEMTRGACLTTEKTWDITVYTACMNADKGLYYYTTYDNRQIACVDMHRTDLDGETLCAFPLIMAQQVLHQN